MLGSRVFLKRFDRLDSAVNAAETVGKFHGQTPIALFDDDDDWNLVMGINVNVARPSTRCLSTTYGLS
jgi:hypothetical protein